MNVMDAMRFIESEFIIINSTPCSVCGGHYITESSGFHVADHAAMNVTSCYCERCGSRKDFSFRAPQISSMDPSTSIQLN
ncbi:hypothetical protein ABB02_00738 [Clostridiaceae bacterium JG1575]|nr:hypothetical protein ABB02_00738 [Clostridiaceae bacterium JG1575]